MRTFAAARRCATAILSLGRSKNRSAPADLERRPGVGQRLLEQRGLRVDPDQHGDVALAGRPAAIRAAARRATIVGFGVLVAELLEARLRPGRALGDQHVRRGGPGPGETADQAARRPPGGQPADPRGYGAGQGDHLRGRPVVAARRITVADRELAATPVRKAGEAPVNE